MSPAYSAGPDKNEETKDVKKVRYAYSLTTALLLGGATLSIVTGNPAGAQVAQNDASQMSRMVPRAGAPASFAELTEQLQPSVVNIATRQRVQVQNNPFAGTPLGDLFGGGRGGGQATREAQSLGSGFIISADGYVVTNNHVVAPEGRGTIEEITVTTSDGTEYEAELVGRDAASDLAVLKISRREAFPFVQFGDSAQSRVGDWVIAIGNPFGLSGTVTSGIVSAVYRNTGANANGAYDRYIQTDASINRGNSGGPLFDMQGNVIGINNAIFSPSGGSVGIGFAIPAEIAQPIVEQLRRGEEIERGYLGVGIANLTDEIADARGLPKNRGELVQTVEPGGPADRAGIEAGDLVLTIDGKDVTPDDTLSYLIANIKPGTRVPIEVLRAGERQRITTTVGKRPTEEEFAQRRMFEDDDPQFEDEQGETSDSIAGALGLQLVPVDPNIAGQLGIARDTTGLAVVRVDPTSDAAARGIQRRDVITSVQQRPVASIADLEAIIAQAREAGRGAVELRISRSGRPLGSVGIRLRD